MATEDECVDDMTGTRAVDGLGVQQGPRFFQAFCRRLFVVSSLLVIAREREVHVSRS